MIGTLIGVAIIGLIGVLRYAPKPPPSAKPLEVQRSELTLHDGRLCRIGQTNPFTGLLVEYYESGSLQSRSMVSNGQLHGVSEGWHTNQQIAVREHFREGISYGPRTKWYPTGALLSEAAIKDGQLDGTFTRWHENGAPAEQIQMRNGQPEGISRAYYPSGFLKAQANMKRGQVLEQQFWKDGEFNPKS